MAEFSKKKRVFIVTDKPLYDLGVSRKVTALLDSMRIQHKTYYHVESDPELGMILDGLKEVRSFQPDLFIAIGGGSPMDAAKVMRVLYENPEHTFESLAARCTDIRKRPAQALLSGTRAELVCVPTTSGTGSDVAPYCVVSDTKTGERLLLADYALTPSMSIVDAQLVMSMPRTLAAHSGLHALAHAIEAHASPLGNDYTRGLSQEAVGLILAHLPRSYGAGELAAGELAAAADAREAMHNAGTLAGMALANTSPGGVCHALAHRVGAAFRLPQGLAHAALITHVVAADSAAAPLYAELARHVGVGGASDAASVQNLIKALEDLKKTVGVPPSLAGIFGSAQRAVYLACIPDIAELAAADVAAAHASAGAGAPAAPTAAALERVLEAAWGQ